MKIWRVSDLMTSERERGLRERQGHRGGIATVVERVDIIEESRDEALIEKKTVTDRGTGMDTAIRN